jgi:hypothetical protein
MYNCPPDKKHLMKKLKLSLFIILLSAFNAAIGADVRPEWIDNPESGFFNKEIFAVGFGETLKEAQSSARAEILKYFETNITASFTGSLSADDAKTSKLSREDIEETTNGIIKGIVITNTYKDKDGFYALAVLDKEKTINELAYEISKLDSEMKLLLEDEASANTSQLKKLYLQRAEINKKYMFLTDKTVEEHVKYEDIFKKAKSQGELSFYLSFKSKGYSEAATILQNKLSVLITDNGSTVSDDIKLANRVLATYITLDKQYLNVGGFLKYKVSFRIECKNGKQVLGALSESYSEAGRSVEQIYDKAVEQFLNYIENNYLDLIK